MKKGLRTIPFFVIATVAMAFAFATCSVDDLLADASENGNCATGTAEHTWNTGKITTPATEDNDGETLFTCTKCGKTKTEAIPALGHKHTIANEWTSDEAYHWHEASCEKETHRTDKAAHKWDEGETTTAATETDDGETLFTCTTCGTTKTEAIPALGHEHIMASEWTSDEAHHWHEASCGREEHRTGKTAHEWDNGEVTTAPTCTATGETTYTCTVCGKTRTEAIAITEHEWDDGTIATAATETDDGETLFTCTTCGTTKTEAIPALGHEHIMASEWTSDEAHHWHEASCGREEHRADKATHEWDKGVIITAATEIDDGETLFTCTTCGTTKTEAIPALGHEHIIASEWSSDEQFHWRDASCGREEHRTGKTAHGWDNGKVTTAPTCFTEGETTYTCTTCGRTRAESIATIEHEWDDGIITKAATEQETGEKAFTCTVCGRIRREVIPVLEHEHIMASEWTSDEAHHWHEVSCGREEHRTGKTAHTWDNGKTTKAATCTAAGETTYTCIICRKTRTESIAMTEHSYSTTWKSDANGHWNGCIGCGKQENFAEHATMIVTLTSDGERKESCPTCGYGAAPSAWTKETLSELSNALENYAKTNTNAKVKVVGELSEYSITGATTNSISYILYNFSSKYGSSKQVDIDLSGTTGLTKINDMCFRSYTSLASITLPNGITTIGKEAFKGCTSLTRVTLPNDLTTIGDYAFSGCTSLTNVTFPNGLTTIGKYAFNECTSLASATLPNGLTTILDYTFSGCTSLASITIPDSVTTIWNAAFNKCTSLTNVTLPANITEIRTAVFSGCTNLASITIPKSVTKIGRSAFSSCEQLEKVENMEGVTIIDERAFQSCKSLKTIRFSPSVTEIGEYAFHFSGLETIEFSEGLKKIKSHAFGDCSKLMNDIEIPSSVIILEGASAFSGCTSLTRIIFKDTSGWLSCTREVDLSNPVSNAFRLVNSYPASSLIGSDLYKE